MKKLDKKLYTFTKTWIDRLMWCFIIWLSLIVVQPFFDKSPTEELGKTIMTAGVVLFAGYMLKAFFETFSEENLKYKRELKGIEKIDERSDLEPTEGEESEE